MMQLLPEREKKLMILSTNKEKVVEIDIEPSSSGAPCPMLLSDEYNLYVAYYMQDSPKHFKCEAIGLVEFSGFHVYQFGPPNDEAFHGHPLYKKGLKPYSSFEIQNSTWVAMFEKRNSVHPYHSKDKFLELKHYVWSFHDTTLEVISSSYNFKICDGTISGVIQDIAKGLK